MSQVKEVSNTAEDGRKAYNMTDFLRESEVLLKTLS